MFKFSQEEIKALQCTRSRSLEADIEMYGGVDEGLRKWESNLPGAYLDTEQFDGDKSRVLTVGSESAASLVADTEYYTEITVYEFGIKDQKNYAEIYLNFQRGHWASSLPEQAFCAAKGGPENCIFGDDPSQYMKSALGSTPRVDFERYPVLDSATWGSYRRTELRPGEQLNSGDQIYSPSGEYRLAMRPNGNLTEYGKNGEVLWESGTSEPESIAISQLDGNLVIVAPGNRPIWSTNVTSDSGTTYQLQDDGNFVGYTDGHVPAWATQE